MGRRWSKGAEFQSCRMNAFWRSNVQQKRLVIYGAHGRRVQADGGKAGYLSRQVAIFKKQMLAKGDWQQAKGSFQSTEVMPTDSSQLLIMASPLGP